MPITIEDDVKQAFNEENRNLEKVENRIQKLVQEKETVFREIDKEIANYYVLDYEDLQNKQFLIADRQKKENDLEEIKSYIPSPYFGRIDLARNDEDSVTYFIGEKALLDRTDAIILDWRDPVGNTFYNKSEHAFLVKGIKYDLLLRRAVDIQGARLISVNTEFDLSNLSLEGEVIDQFLLSVLRDKRRNYKLTNIIRSIQGNQNEIIRKEVYENFVVQGCAGSGKTMILLHRLSYICFNHPEFQFSNCYILTPNVNFNIQIDELSRSLGLEKVKRLTIEEFYAYIISTKAGLDTVVKSNGHRLPKMECNLEKIQSEKALNAELLAHIYSDAFFEEITSNYLIQAKAAAVALSALGAIDILSRNGYSIKERAVFNYLYFDSLYHALYEMIRKHNDASTVYNTAKQKHDETEKKISDLKAALQYLEELYGTAKTNLTNTIKERRNSLDAENKNELFELRELQRRIENSKAEKTQLFERARSIEDSIRRVKVDEQSLTSSEYLLSSPEEIAVSIRDICPDECSKLRELNAQLATLAFYNFGKRGRIRTEIEALEKIVAVKSEIIIRAYKDTKVSEASECRKAIKLIDETIIQLNAAIAELQRKSKNVPSTLRAYNLCIDAMNTESTFNLEPYLSAEEISSIGPIYQEYKRVEEDYVSKKTELSSLIMSERRLADDVHRLESGIIQEDELSCLNKALSIVNEFDMTNLLKNVEQKLKDLFENYFQTYPIHNNYRHMLYVKLVLCMLYYGPVNERNFFIHIDEAQDLSPSEYKLLKSCLGDKTIFNLYGDVNQSIYTYKGISDWEEINSIIPLNLYFLNENYRNTCQITEYCNEVFGAQITAVGLNGNEVRKLGFYEAVEDCVRELKKQQKKRLAVIYKFGQDSVVNALKTNYDSLIEFNKITTEKISAITVDESKGLEFDGVVVVSNGMSVNERYIAYTRALDNLVITSLPVVI